jgi:phage terminase small subunit
VMNDPGADDGRRDRMAVAAAPYIHARAAEQVLGKKEQQQEHAKEAARSPFVDIVGKLYTLTTR